MGSLNTAIVGGGVAGLALARGLLRREGVTSGRRLRLFERQHDQRSQGFGFLVQASGCEALRDLGLDPGQPGFAQPLRQVRVYANDGRLLNQHALVDTVAMERPTLLTALAQGLPGGILQSGRPVEQLLLSQGRVRALRFASGEDHPVDLVIAADGAHSRCRRVLESGPRLPGRLARVQEIVACVDNAAVARELDQGFIKLLDPAGGLAVGLVPLPGGRVIWFVQFDSQRHRLLSGTPLLAFLQRVLRDFPDWLRQFLGATDPALPHHWRPLDLDPPSRLVGPNLALIGDAAHPMLPFTSQGVNLALADAALLAALLPQQADPDAVSAALRYYEQQRQPLRTPFVAMGRAMAADFLASGQRCASRPPVAP